MSTRPNRARRLDDLKTMLERRRAELANDVHDRIRKVRIDGGIERTGLDEAESAEVGVQDDIGFALIQLKAENLDKINNALRRIADGNYGECLSCGGDISETRLRALPFALRCKDCEEAREASYRNAAESSSWTAINRLQ